MGWVQIVAPHDPREDTSVWHSEVTAREYQLKHGAINDEWIELTTGARVLLINDAGWREAADGIPVAFHILYRSPVGDIVEQSDTVLLEEDRRFYGTGQYDGARKRCRERIDTLLDSR